MPMSHPPFDAYTPAEIAAKIETVGVAKAKMPTLPMLALGILAGAFIAFGAMFYTMAVTGSELGLGPTRVLGGLVFSLGLVLVVIAGAELFTGNNLIVMAWAERKITTGLLLRNWALTYMANGVGAVGMAGLVVASGTLLMGEGAVLQTAITIAEGKVRLGFAEAFVRGLLCNMLVCLAVWLSYASHRISGKILAIVFPITAFVALGFEHSIANLYFLPLGALTGAEGVTGATILANLLPVTLGNIVGGAVFVALFYWVIYLRKN